MIVRVILERYRRNLTNARHESNGRGVWNTAMTGAKMEHYDLALMDTDNLFYMKLCLCKMLGRARGNVNEALF